MDDLKAIFFSFVEEPRKTWRRPQGKYADFFDPIRVLKVPLIVSPVIKKQDIILYLVEKKGVPRPFLSDIEYIMSWRNAHVMRTLGKGKRGSYLQVRYVPRVDNSL